MPVPVAASRKVMPRTCLPARDVHDGGTYGGSVLGRWTSVKARKGEDMRDDKANQTKQRMRPKAERNEKNDDGARDTKAEAPTTEAKAVAEK